MGDQVGQFSGGSWTIKTTENENGSSIIPLSESMYTYTAVSGCNINVGEQRSVYKCCRD